MTQRCSQKLGWHNILSNPTWPMNGGGSHKDWTPRGKWSQLSALLPLAHFFFFLLSMPRMRKGSGLVWGRGYKNKLQEM